LRRVQGRQEVAPRHAWGIRWGTRKEAKKRGHKETTLKAQEEIGTKERQRCQT
jgi:hypothetical protein